MNENKTPRKRVTNFTTHEKALLIQLIKKRPIIETKLTDGKTVTEKKLAWNEVTEEFNFNGHVHKRDTITLKRAWDNLKAMARKARGTERGSLLRTGGPSTVNMVEDVNHEAIENILYNEFDQNFAKDHLDIVLEEGQNITQSECYAGENRVSEDITKISAADKPKSLHSIEQTELRKPLDYVRREGVLRIKHLEAKKKIEIEILNLKLENEQIKKRAAELEEERSKTLLEISKLELRELKKRLGIN